MARPLLIDLRARIVPLAEAGHSIREVAARYHVAPSTVSNLVRHLRRTGSLEPLRTGPRRGHGFERHCDWLLDQIKERPDQIMLDLAARLPGAHGVKAAPADLSRRLIRQGYSYKKTLMASERAKTRVVRLRREWLNDRMPAMRRTPGRLVFIDGEEDRRASGAA